MTSVHSASSEVADCLVWYCVQPVVRYSPSYFFFHFFFLSFSGLCLDTLLCPTCLSLYTCMYISAVPLAAPSGISAFCICAGLGTVVVFCQMPCVYKQELCSCVGVCFKQPVSVTLLQVRQVTWCFMPSHPVQLYRIASKRNQSLITLAISTTISVAMQK